MGECVEQSGILFLSFWKVANLSSEELCCNKEARELKQQSSRSSKLKSSQHELAKAIEVIVAYQNKQQSLHPQDKQQTLGRNEESQQEIQLDLESLKVREIDKLLKENNWPRNGNKAMKKFRLSSFVKFQKLSPEDKRKIRESISNMIKLKNVKSRTTNQTIRVWNEELLF